MTGQEKKKKKTRITRLAPVRFSFRARRVVFSVSSFLPISFLYAAALYSAHVRTYVSTCAPPVTPSPCSPSLSLPLFSPHTHTHVPSVWLIRRCLQHDSATGSNIEWAPPLFATATFPLSLYYTCRVSVSEQFSFESAESSLFLEHVNSYGILMYVYIQSIISIYTYIQYVPT